MADRIDENMLGSLIEQVKSFQTTGFSGFGYWKKGYDTELTQEEGRLFQLYAGLGVLVRDMWLYLKEHSRNDAKLFEKIVRPIIDANQQQYPETTIFRPLAQRELPEGFAAAAVEGHPTVTGLDDRRIVHEWTTKEGKKAFYGFYQTCRDELCGPASPYELNELIRQGKVDKHELGLRFAKVFQDRCFSDDPLWQPMSAYLSVCAISKLETIAGARELSQFVKRTEAGNGEPETQTAEKRINVWISERTAEPERPLVLGERYTLKLGVGKEVAASLLGGKDATVPAQDLAGGGLETEWVVSTSAFELASDDSNIAPSTKASNLQAATFPLWIPEKGESEVRRLFIVPRSRGSSRLEILIFAVRASQSELYRKFSIEVQVESTESTSVEASGATVLDELIFAPGRQMNLGTTHEWTTPPGRLTVAVLPGGQKAYVTGDLPGRHVNDFVDWYGQQATLKGSIDNVRAAAEKFRGKWQDYLNDIDTKDLETRLTQFAPTYDWASWQSRADSQHAKNWFNASTSVELRELAIYGHMLYQTAFPARKELRTWLDLLRPGTRLEITWKVDEPGSGNVPNVPWGLMYQPDPPTPGEAVDPMGFLALRFRLEYWGYEGVSAASKALGAMAKAHQAYCLYWGSNPNDETGIEAAWQRQQFQHWQNQVFAPHIPDSPNAYAEVLQAFSAPELSPTPVLYFFCQAAVGEGNKPVLRFGPTSGPTDVLQTTDLLSLIGKPLVDQPLVFANACTTSSADPYVANELQKSLFGRGCRAFLGTETKVPIQLASRFATIFFNFFYRRIDSAPMAAGEALAQTRLFLLTEYNNIGGIFYAYLNQYELFMADQPEVEALRAA
jgi:hypothetical protein